MPSEARFLNHSGRIFDKSSAAHGSCGNPLAMTTQLHCVEHKLVGGERETTSSPPERKDAGELDEEIVQKILASNPSYSAEEVRRGVHEPNSFLSLLYSRFAEENRALMVPVHPSYVPSIISSLNSTSAGGSLKKNFLKGTRLRS